LRRLGSELDAFAEQIDVFMFAAMSAGQIRIARNLLQNRVQLSGSRRDPLQIFLVQHKPRIYLSLSFKHAHQTQNNTAKTATPKAANVTMNQNKFTSTVHAPLGRCPSIAIISFYGNLPSRFYLTHGQCTTLQRTAD